MLVLVCRLRLWMPAADRKAAATLRWEAGTPGAGGASRDVPVAGSTVVLRQEMLEEMSDTGGRPSPFGHRICCYKTPFKRES